jgi:glyoxylase-like metal-dependent hydrolase (beta-lactamase superfamily II)
MKIIPLSEGTFTIDKTKVFVPFELEKDSLQSRTSGSLLVEIQPFAIVTSRDILLIDTGLGFAKDNKLQIYNNLEANNINYQQVTKVLLSHLHKDHAGGVSVKDKLGHYSLTFPNANHYVQKSEIDYAFEVGFPSYMVDEIGILVDNPKVTLLEGTGDIDEYIHYEISGGHSPYHQAFWIHDDGETVFFGGDDAPQLQQMKSKFVAKYDYDGKKSMQLRQHWWQQGHEQKWKFLFYHDIKAPVFER